MLLSADFSLWHWLFCQAMLKARPLCLLIAITSVGMRVEQMRFRVKSSSYRKHLSPHPQNNFLCQGIILHTLVSLSLLRKSSIRRWNLDYNLPALEGCRIRGKKDTTQGWLFPIYFSWLLTSMGLLILLSMTPGPKVWVTAAVHRAGNSSSQRNSREEAREQLQPFSGVP